MQLLIIEEKPRKELSKRNSQLVIPFEDVSSISTYEGVLTVAFNTQMPNYVVDTNEIVSVEVKNTDHYKIY